MAVHTSLQSVFNVIWAEFVIRNRIQATDMHGTCVYRDSDRADSPVRCALGVCIPDDMYDPNIETKNPSELQDIMPAWYESVFNGLEPTRLSELQNIHDFNFCRMEELLRDFAAVNHLSIPQTT